MSIRKSAAKAKALTYREIRALSGRDLDQYLRVALKAEQTALARLERAGLGNSSPTRYNDTSTRHGMELELKQIINFLNSPLSSVTKTRAMLKDAADQYARLTGTKPVGARNITPEKITKMTGKVLRYNPKNNRIEIGDIGIPLSTTGDINDFWTTFHRLQSSDVFSKFVGSEGSAADLGKFADVYDSQLTDDEMLERLIDIEQEKSYPSWLPPEGDPFWTEWEELK